MVPRTASQRSALGTWPGGQRTGRPTGVASARQQRTSRRANWGWSPFWGQTNPLIRTGSPS